MLIEYFLIYKYIAFIPYINHNFSHYILTDEKDKYELE